MKKRVDLQKEILETGILLAKEKDRTKLLEMILDKGMRISGCDAGTLYVYENDALTFKIMKTRSMHVSRGGDGERIDLPPVPMREENVCAYAGLHRKIVNIRDVSESEEFDFSGPKKYDSLTGYQTKTMLVLPVMNQEDTLIGVLQLINAMDETGRIIPFSEELEPVILSLTSQAAIVMSNILYLEEMRQQMWSFTEAMAEAIDARTPYNGTHTRKVADYAGTLCDYINELHAQGKEPLFFDENRRDQLVMGALLHDIGKMIIPLEVMNKASRLGNKREQLEARFLLLELKYENAALRGLLPEEDAIARKKQLEELTDLVRESDGAEFLTAEQSEQLEKAFLLSYEVGEERIPYFTEEEKTCLRVVRGTLTKEERDIMETHVEMTERILKKVHFNQYFKNSPRWAVTHHELLDGSGYPRHLTGEQLEPESRILTVADICDALLATDRPYKKPMSRERAFSIMEAMAEEGKLDKTLVGYAKQCLAK